MHGYTLLFAVLQYDCTCAAANNAGITNTWVHLFIIENVINMLFNAGPHVLSHEK